MASDLSAAAQQAWHVLYDRAEDAAVVGLPLDEALEAVRSGYSSIDADRMIAEDP